MEILKYGSDAAVNILIQAVDEHDLELIESEIAGIKEETTEGFCLLAVKIQDWNRELSPWQAPAVFGKEDFGAGAAETLKEIEKLCADPMKNYYIGGYSLAGLFALWAAYQTDLFKGVAAASPSMWFPGFIEYMSSRQIRCGKVYLSLGDKEDRSRNPVMASVSEKIRAAEKILKEREVQCTLEWNPGNHFRDSDLRRSKAFAWILQQ